MLTHPTLDKLRSLRLEGMAKSLEEQLQMPDIEELRFEDRLALLIDREVTEMNYRRQQSRLRKAKLRQKMPVSKTSIFERAEDWIKSSFCISAPASGSGNIEIF